MKYYLVSAFAACVGAVCCACAPLPAHHDVDWHNGARNGWIAGFYDATTPLEQLPLCLAGLPPAELAAHRYARIDYRHTRRMLTEVAPLPVDLPAKLGDRVELWPQDCDQGKLSRISRIVPPAPPST